MVYLRMRHSSITKKPVRSPFLIILNPPFTYLLSSTSSFIMNMSPPDEEDFKLLDVESSDEEDFKLPEDFKLLGGERYASLYEKARKE